MKRWMLAVLVAVLGLNAIGCHNDKADDTNSKEMKVKVDTK